MREAVIVALGRSAIGKAPKGKLKYTRPDDIGAQVLKGVLAQVPQLDPAEIEDVVVGCATPEGEQGLNIAKMICERAELPISVSGQTVNRFCASGLQSISIAANSIKVGEQDVVVAGGVESMSMIPMGGGKPSPNPFLVDNYPEKSASMGLTAENIVDKYGIAREDMDKLGVESQIKAYEAQQAGHFDDQIIPITAVRPVKDENGMVTGTETFIFDKDEGIRPGSNLEGAAKLRPAFRKGGTVTAANSSQTSDGAAFVVLMSREKAESLGIKPLGIFREFAVAGVPAERMGEGPAKAIPKVLNVANKSVDDIDIWELNEAFASQALYCSRELGLDMDKVNLDGGAIALGHPLGCTGSFLTVKMLSILKRENKKYGVVSMCIGGGMGAAAIIENI